MNRQEVVEQIKELLAYSRNNVKIRSKPYSDKAKDDVKALEYVLRELDIGNNIADDTPQDFENSNENDIKEVQEVKTLIRTHKGLGNALTDIIEIKEMVRDNFFFNTLLFNIKDNKDFMEIRIDKNKKLFDFDYKNIAGTIFCDDNGVAKLQDAFYVELDDLSLYCQHAKFKVLVDDYQKIETALSNRLDAIRDNNKFFMSIVEEGKFDIDFLLDFANDEFDNFKELNKYFRFY